MYFYKNVKTKLFARKYRLYVFDWDTASVYV